MENIPFHISRLLASAVAGTLDATEELELNAWRNIHPDNEQLYQKVMHHEIFIKDLQAINRFDVACAYEQVSSKIEREDKKKGTTLIRKIAVAAIVLVTLGFSAYWLGGGGKSTGGDIRPGGNRARLTLADGSVVELSEQHGEIIFGDSLYYADGTSLGASVDGKDVGMLKLATPKGGQYTIVLPDGSRVWLNAESSLTYPGSFDRVERQVELEGEAYFEISKKNVVNGNKTTSYKPFTVKTNNQVVRVLGTVFNVSAYPDEKWTKTTLVEGSVAITVNRDTKKEYILKPGQQGIADEGGLQVKDIDLAAAVAWKNGQFVFVEEPLESVMQKVARWYNVEVVFEDKTLQRELIEGMVPRYTVVSELLDVLEKGGNVKFKIKDDKIYVIKKVKL